MKNRKLKILAEEMRGAGLYTAAMLLNRAIATDQADKIERRKLKRAFPKPAAIRAAQIRARENNI